tara:strand:- start:2644 stop:3513 length:870 start_codon:yes stop_codon:yes gene_type:complete
MEKFNHLLEKANLYLQLMRVDRPIGFYLLMWPVLWAFMISTSGKPTIFYMIVFGIGIIVTRSAGCIINDYFDQEYDRKVERTKNRVLADKKISNQEALILFLLLILICFVLLLMLDLKILLFAIISLCLLISYPLMKRFFKIPQLILGLAFGSSIPMVFILEAGEINLNCVLLYSLTVIWAIVYDTYYAMADKKDDKKVGIQSSALFFGENDVKYSSYLHYTVIILFALIGLINNFDLVFYAIMLLSCLCVIYQNLLVRNRVPYQCISAFENNNIFGLIVTFGLLFNYL